MLRKCYQRRLITLAFVALVLENELQYHGLAVRANRTYLRMSGMTRPKTGVYSLISPDIVD